MSSNLYPTTSNHSTSNRLHVPRHSYNPSISSIPSSAGPQYLNTRTKSGTTVPKLSRTSTEATDGNVSQAIDTQSMYTIDRIQSTKPSVSYLDKLWTQIDVLDDVKNMSNEVKLRGSFFNDKFNLELARLKLLHNKLLETMATQHFTATSHKKQLSKLDSINTNETSVAGSSPVTEEDEQAHKLQEKAHDFFQSKQGQDILHRKQNFEEINHYVNEINQNLQAVAASMNRFDETTKEMW